MGGGKKKKKRSTRNSKIAGAIGAVALLLLGAILSPIGERIGLRFGEEVLGSDSGYRITVQRDTSQNEHTSGFVHYWLAASTPEGLDAPPDWRRSYEWSRDNDAVDLGTTRFNVTVTSIDASVQIVGARIEIVREADPKTDGMIVGCLSCGGESLLRTVQVDLDSGLVQYFNDKALSPEPFSFALLPNEAERFEVNASSFKRDVVWRMKLDLIVDGEPTTADMGAPEEEFTTLGLSTDASSRIDRFDYVDGSWIQG